MITTTEAPTETLEELEEAMQHAKTELAALPVRIGAARQALTSARIAREKESGSEGVQLVRQCAGDLEELIQRQDALTDLIGSFGTRRQKAIDRVYRERRQEAVKQGWATLASDLDTAARRLFDLVGVAREAATGQGPATGLDLGATCWEVTREYMNIGRAVSEIRGTIFGIQTDAGDKEERLAWQAVHTPFRELWDVHQDAGDHQLRRMSKVQPPAWLADRLGGTPR